MTDSVVATGKMPTQVVFRGGIMHNKVMIIDGKLLVTGSCHWSANAEDKNFENAIFIQASSVIQKYQADFEKIWAR